MPRSISRSVIRVALALALPLSLLSTGVAQAKDPGLGCGVSFTRDVIADIYARYPFFPAGLLEPYDLNGNGYICDMHIAPAHFLMLHDDNGPVRPIS